MSDKVEFIESEKKIKEEIVDTDVTTVLSGEIDVTPENIVKMTQVVRGGILKKITDHGTRLPTDADEVATTLAILKDMDHTALTTSKLNIEEQKANTASQVAAVADSILSRMAFGTGNPVPRNIEEDIELPDVPMLDGEGDQGEISLNPDEWLVDRD